MTATSNQSVPAAATVRLTPSIATNAFSTIPNASAAGSSKRTRSPWPSRARKSTRATASTCPYTKCPPMRSPARSANSTLTRSPGTRSPSVLRASVSGTTSNESAPPSTFVTVRQTPSIAIESFGVTASSSAASQRTRNVAPPPASASFASTTPRCATIPLNNDAARNDHVVADAQGAIEMQLRMHGGEVDTGKHRNRSFAAHQPGRDSPVKALDQSVRDQSCSKRRTALAEHAVDARLAERLHRSRQVEARAIRGSDELDVGHVGYIFEPPAKAGRGEHDRGRISVHRSENAARGLNGFGFARDDAQVRSQTMVGRTHRQQRIVDAYGSGPDHDGVVRDSQVAHVEPFGFRPQLLAHAGTRRDRAVERHRHLQSEVRPRRSDRAGEQFDEVRRTRVTRNGDCNPALAQIRYSAAAVYRIRIDGSANHARDAGFRYARRARRHATGASARFERDVEGCSTSSMAGPVESHALGVRGSRAAMIPLPHDGAVAHHDRADGRIRSGAADTARGKLVGALQIEAVERSQCGGGGVHEAPLFVAAATTAPSTNPPASTTARRQSSRVAPVVHTSSIKTMRRRATSDGSQAKRPRAARRSSRVRPRCASPARWRNASTTVARASAEARRASSATPSMPRTRMRFTVVGTGTRTDCAATNGAMRSPSASATSRRPSFSAKIADRRMPSYVPYAVTSTCGIFRRTGMPEIGA